MPTYEYQCLSCGRHVEIVQRFSDEPLRTCEHCGGPLRRVFHPVGILLKGSGFYSTDNRAGSKHRLAESKESKESKKEESTTETKPSETKKEAKPASDTKPSSSSSSSSSSDSGTKKKKE